MPRSGFLTLALALILAASLGCDNRTKTEKAMDTIKVKASSAFNKLKDISSQGDFLAAAEKQIAASKQKLDELGAKLKEANPEMKAKLDQQVAALKTSISEAEDAIKKAAAEPEKTWATLKAKALEALKKAEDAGN